MNVFGLLPWAATATADITVTAILALFTFLLPSLVGLKIIGNMYFGSLVYH